MPTYEYRCLVCNRRFDIFMTYSEYGTKPVSCTHCGSTNVQRLISRVRFARSEEGLLEDLDSPDALAGLEENPRELGRVMRKLSKEAGEDLGPEFDEVIGRLEAGQSPEEIEREIPELGGSGLDDNDLLDE
ncbi:MAG: FmdB family zinc ribbon protein [Anaerolineales bacterium]|jgi:putative FmdB family regulatory protein